MPLGGYRGYINRNWGKEGWVARIQGQYFSQASCDKNLMSKKHGVNVSIVDDKRLVFLGDFSSRTPLFDPPKQENESIHWSETRKWCTITVIRWRKYTGCGQKSCTLRLFCILLDKCLEFQSEILPTYVAILRAHNN